MSIVCIVVVIIKQVTSTSQVKKLYFSSLQVYFWIYDPVHFKTFAMGLILGGIFFSPV